MNSIENSDTYLYLLINCFATYIKCKPKRDKDRQKKREIEKRRENKKVVSYCREHGVGVE